MAALTGGKGFPFLFQHIRDGINIRQTCNLIFSLCRYNNRLAEHVSFFSFKDDFCPSQQTDVAGSTRETNWPFPEMIY